MREEMNTWVTATVDPEQHFVLSFTQDKRGYCFPDVYRSLPNLGPGKTFWRKGYLCKDFKSEYNLGCRECRGWPQRVAVFKPQEASGLCKGPGYSRWPCLETERSLEWWEEEGKEDQGHEDAGRETRGSSRQGSASFLKSLDLEP